MKNKSTKVRRGSVTVTINKTSQAKKGRVYTAYVVSDYSNGSRKQWPFADLADAKTKAVGIADAIDQGLSEKERWEIGQPLNIKVYKPAQVRACERFRLVYNHGQQVY